MRRTLALVAVAAVLLTAGVLAGCGSEGNTTASPETVEGTLPVQTTPTETVEVPKGDAAAGKAVFTSYCGSCHTLADAGAHGAVGPNLDQAKPPAALVFDRVTNGKGNMPAWKGTLTEKQIADVTAYVVQATGG